MDFNSVIWFIFYCLAVIGSILGEEIEKASEPRLRVISAVFRHGDRAPTKREIYPNDPYRNESFYPDGYGELTAQGQLRATELGRRLRARYINSMKDKFSPDDVSTVSTCSNRAQKTLELVLAEFFPEWNKLINRDVLNDTENFMSDWYCPRYDLELDRVINSSEVISEVAKFREFMENLSNLTGRNISSPSDMLRLYNLLDAESSLNLTLPDWTKDIFPRGQLLDGAILAYRIKSFSSLLRKLNGGKLLLNMIRKMEALQKSILQKNPKINLYSGHETNIASLLNTLGVYEPQVPQYTSAVIIEFYERKFQHYVKIVYYLGRPNTFRDLQIPGCDEFCPFNKFLRLLGDVIPEDESICHQ